MSVYIILAFIVFALLFMAFKLFSPKYNPSIGEVNQANDQLNTEPKSKPGFFKIDLGETTLIEVTLAHDTLSNFKNQNRVSHIETIQEPTNNRYSYYSCDLGGDDDNERQIQLHLELNGRTFNFENVFDLSLKQTNEIIEGVEFEQRWSQENSSLEQAFQDYKRFMLELLDFGCQNYFGLEDVRYRKDEYNKVLKSSDHTCLAPDLIQFEEFKAVLESEDFSSLDSCFYVGDYTIYISYTPDYSATFEIEYTGSVYSYLSYFGCDDLYLDELTLNEKQIKFEKFIAESLAAREEEENEANEQDFGIDESYIDPFIEFKI